MTYAFHTRFDFSLFQLALVTFTLSNALIIAKSVIVSNFIAEKIAAMFAVRFTWLHVAQHVS